MPAVKAALFVDNSNIFKGMSQFSRSLMQSGKLGHGQYLGMRWDRLIDGLQSQETGLDIFARHFFASLPPAADVRNLRRRPTQVEWDRMVKKSAQSGFYKAIQGPPCNFRLHGIPLHFAEASCGRQMRTAYYKCVGDSTEVPSCLQSINPDSCSSCNRKFIRRFEKGVDVALATQLVIFSGSKVGSLDRVILVAGDGDYKEALRFAREETGRDVQIVSWRRALSADLERLANKPVILLDDHWEEVCEVRTHPPLEETPASDEAEPDAEDRP